MGQGDPGGRNQVELTDVANAGKTPRYRGVFFDGSSQFG